MDIDRQKLWFDQSMPKGIKFFDWIFAKDSEKEKITLELISEDDEFNALETFEVIPEFLEVLYKIATCGYGCKGGPHVIEYITARGYNLGIASIKLIRLGFYDESISLIRSISEIINLFGLFGMDSESLSQWYHQTERERIHEFSPSKVRKKIMKTGLEPPISREYYSKMCEVGVHVHPNTKPQGKNHVDRALVGGIVVKEQAISVLNDLATNLAWLVIMSLRNSLDKETFMKETERMNPLWDKIGSLNLETLDDYLVKNKNSS